MCFIATVRVEKVRKLERKSEMYERERREKMVAEKKMMNIANVQMHQLFDAVVIFTKHTRSHFNIKRNAGIRVTHETVHKIILGVVKSSIRIESVTRIVQILAVPHWNRLNSLEHIKCDPVETVYVHWAHSHLSLSVILDSVYVSNAV